MSDDQVIEHSYRPEPNTFIPTDYDMATFNRYLADFGLPERAGCKTNEGDFSYRKCSSHGNGLPDDKDLLKVRLYKDRWGIPFSANPSKDSLIYYNYKNLFSHQYSDPATKQFGRYQVAGSGNPYFFKKRLYPNVYVRRKMQSTALLSYLIYENGEITSDEISPENRFGRYINNNTLLRSNSVGKSMASYVLGHAICKGYINSVHTVLDDWPLLKGTLYDGQKLLDILNMTSGDQDYIYDSFFINKGTWATDSDSEADKLALSDLLSRLQNSKAGPKRYNYNIANTKIILNYVAYKSGKNFDRVLRSAFADSGKIANIVYFNRINERSRTHGNVHSMFFASRYDYLRIARSMANHWQEDTCVGRYLKDLYENRVSKGSSGRNEPAYNASKSYGGQFHFDYPGLTDRIIFGMGGYGGQAILIDMESSKILVVNSIHYNNSQYEYGAREILLNEMKN